jgi:hypothetical protein
MPGNPKECREHAKRCLQLAHETTNPVLKESLTDIAGQWTRLATDLEVTKLLLDEMGTLQPQTGCISSAESNGFVGLAETLGAAPARSKELFGEGSTHRPNLRSTVAFEIRPGALGRTRVR